MRLSPLPVLILVAVAGLAHAHSGVQNPAVLERMDAMKTMGDATKVLGQMAKGEAPFDADAARDAAARIAAQAARTPALFEAPETDPQSEARAVIWDEFDDFADKSATLEAVASGMAQDVTSLAALRGQMRELGGACKACHEDYRVSN